MKNLFKILILSLLVFSCNKENNNQYYSFSESEKGLNYKKFQDNNYGFTIDIPNDQEIGQG